MKPKLIDKKIKKMKDGKCYFCQETNYSLLDCHRINPGENGGKYTDYNTITTCSNCHRKCHAGNIEIIGKHPLYPGYVLHFIEDGVEKWV